MEQGSTSFLVDTRGFSLHSAIYAARPDVRCIIHLHTPATAAVRNAICLTDSHALPGNEKHLILRCSEWLGLQQNVKWREQNGGNVAVPFGTAKTQEDLKLLDQVIGVRDGPREHR